MGRRPGSWDPPAWSGPWKGLLLAASVLGSCLQPAPAQTPVTIVLTPPSPVVGGGVSLAPQNPPQDFVLCSWYRSATAAETSRILTCFPQTPLVQQNGSAHTGRETVGPGCALHIAGLTLNDTGSYTVQIQSPTSPGLGTVVLRVYEMLPRPTVTPNQTLVLENETFTLRCNSSPSADTVLWLRDGASLASSDRLVLSSDNRTLNVLNVTRGDAGAYQCEVGNPVSSIRSEPSTVTVAYGPESARIEPSELLPQLLGSLVHLTCVSESVPAPHYRWVFNSTELKETGSSLTLNLTSFDQQGMYMCQAHNPITSLTKNSTSLVIQVQEMLPRPTVTPNQTLVLENGTFTLRCNSSPSADTVLWLRDGASLVPSDRLVLFPDNRTLTVLGVTRDDAGAYQCEVRNPVSTNCSEPSTVTVASTPNVSGGGLSPGAIAGIVIGSLAGAALLGGLLYFLLRKTEGGPKQHSPVGGQAAPTHNQGDSDNKPTLGEEDVQYSTLAFTAGDQKPPPGPQPPPESGTVYSEIRKK
ncbi:carcinoembryonic antigen-related cell adhesion molecule 1-like [Gopherus flavomarginatus]|uniref:carcinoembryonic antigen-related cell adhesion molecule 1-like n=1 Tax=Gopherus flavomarginatus TaxID=286002 RepID=UPI0021CBD8F4|nr:carcinoembryonic antigen-related cell adhesion molecule 1-like [Gopherus flavomarginatus]